MRSRVLRPSRLPLLWALIAVAALALGVAVYQLYHAARSEIAEQGARALQGERERALEQIRAYTDAARQSIIEDLASFHVDGLSHALRQWDETNELIVGTFQWEPGRGLLPGTTTPLGVATPQEHDAFWTGFWMWRAQHPDAGARPGETQGAYRVSAIHTTDNPALDPARLGYQNENLELLAYAGRTVDPWAGWAGHLRDPGAPWLFWYQPGPDAPVRGCLADAKIIATQVATQLQDSRLARFALIDSANPAGPDVQGSDVSLIDWLPGYRLRVSAGDILLEKQSSFELLATIVVLLAAVFVLGVVMVVRFSQREIRDAERKTTFVSQVSHELRTPLTSIRMFADMLGAPALAEDKRVRFAETISRESQRLSALIERLLAFNALARGKQHVAIGDVDVDAVINETLEEMSGTLSAAGMRVQRALVDGPVVAATDRSTLKQALMNLLDNVLKYAANGHQVGIETTVDDGLVRVRVADCGPGIPADLRGRIFEPFVQGGQTLSDKPAGLGLGLSIARGMLREAGGDLVLLSADAGAVFEIRLPRPNHAP